MPIQLTQTETLVVVAKRADLVYRMAGALRYAAPIPRTAPRTGYETTQAEADALRDAWSRHYAGEPGMFHYRLTHTHRIDGWERKPATIPTIVDFRSHQLVSVSSIGADNPAMTPEIHAHLNAIVDAVRRGMAPQIAAEVSALSTLAADDILDGEGLANIRFTHGAPVVVAGWPARSFLTTPVDAAANQAIAFMRSITK